MAPKGAQPWRAAQYVRMSTEHQRYSTENQSDAIAHYAEQRGIEIVRTYSDEGKSGLRIQGRDGLKQLIDDIQSGKADFEAVLVYDISRWGRFQDADESAYYGAARRIRTGLHKDSGTARYAVPRPRHSARAAARLILKLGRE